MDEPFRKYQVHLQTKPGMCTQHDGYVEVFARNEKEAIDKAFAQLKRTSFPDYSRGMWTVRNVEIVG